jgi:putative ABC transport system permease protein
MGIRMALGARPLDVLGLVIRQAGRLTLLGVAIGLVAALVVARALAATLDEVSAHDPLTFLVVPVALGTAALLGAYLPARRATAADPLTAIRED